jgi:hypothetical protein
MKNSKNNVPPRKKSVAAKPKKGSAGTKDELQSRKRMGDPEFFWHSKHANLLHFDDDENTSLEEN